MCSPLPAGYVYLAFPLTVLVKPVAIPPSYLFIINKPFYLFHPLKIYLVITLKEWSLSVCLTLSQAFSFSLSLPPILYPLFSVFVYMHICIYLFPVQDDPAISNAVENYYLSFLLVYLL